MQILTKRLTKEVLDDKNSDIDVSACLEILKELSQVQVTKVLLETTSLGKLLTKSIRVFKRQKRACDTDAGRKEWEAIMTKANNLMDKWKKAVQEEEKREKEDILSKEGPPKSATEYRTRLMAQKKDMYKDPPALPPLNVTIDESKTYPPPKRNKETGELTFCPGDDYDAKTKTMLKDFHPNRTPEEVLRAGSFGGTYFRPIISAVTNIRYSSNQVLQDTVAPEWIEGLNKAQMLTSKTYHVNVNKYGVKCGGSLGMWESSGWITPIDPYGWFQWYCRFYQGRRSSDDARQISRWLKSAGPKGRFRSQLCNKIIAAGGAGRFDDASISPVIRQTLLHWGLEITPFIVHKHAKRVGYK